VFTKNQLTKMLVLQGQMNSKVNLHWLTANNNWMLAAMMESVEAIDHHGWKWWKKQTPDMPQLQMELVDIWHFGLSHMLVTAQGNVGEIIENTVFEPTPISDYLMFDDRQYKYPKQTLIENLQLMSGLFGAGRFHRFLFMHILEQAGMTTDDLYKQYIGKNVLNFFRQDNGYKEGTYIKVWDGQEDNAHLVEILHMLDSKSETFSEDLYYMLATSYVDLTQ